MAKTYELTASLRTGHLKATDYMEPSWSNFLNWNEESSNRGYAGLDAGYWYYATNMLFDQDTLSSLRTKVSNGITVTGLTLTVYCSKSMTGETLIGYKYNSTTYGDGNSNAWTRCKNDGTSGSGSESLAYLIPAQTLSVGTQSFNLYRADPNTGVARPYSGIPQYGLVAGPQTNVNGRWRFDWAKLYVTTNETDYTLSYNANGGTGAPASDTKTGTTSYTFTISSTVPTWTGYDFLGWSTSSSATSASYQPGDPFTISTNTTLYAVWKKKTYTISYNANGGTNAPGSQTKTYGETLTLTTSKPSRANASAGSYTVTFNANSGSVTPTSASAARTTSYSFNNWNTAANGSGTSYASGANYTANAAATLYAQWTSSTTTAAVTLPSNVSRTGYTFNGWYTASSGGTRVGGAGASYTPTGNVTLFAQWTIITYTVNYNTNGGSGSFAAQTKDYGGSFTIHSGSPTPPSATSAGSYTVAYNANGGSVTPSSVSAARTTNYAFSKWNTAQNGSGANYSPGGTYSANANATLYAQYTSATTTAAVTLTSNVSKSGYSFNGWYTAASGGTRVGGGGSSYTPTGNVTLHAQWTASSATLSSVSPTTVDCGNNLTGSWTSTGNYYYKLKVTCGNATATWSNPTSAGAQSVAVQIPTTWYSMNNGPLRDSETATATCELYTYSDSACTTQVGTASSKTFTVKVPASVKPTLRSGALTASSSSTNSVVSGWGSSVFVQGYSKVTLTLSVSDWHGSRIKEVRFGGLGLSSTKNSLTSDASSVITSAGTFQYYAECEDMRGHVSEKAYVSVAVQPYSQPSVSYITVARCDNTAPDYPVNNAAGLFFKAIPSYGFSSVSGNNHLQVQTIQYRIHPNGGWSAAETCASGVMSGPWSSALTNSYDVMVTLADDLQVAAGTSSYTHFTTTLPTVQGVWIGKGNDRLGLGGVPPSAGLHCDWDATFNGVLDVTPRRCYGTLPTTGNGAGWYKVMDFTGWSSTAPNWAVSLAIDFTITRAYNNNNNEIHRVSLIARYNNVSFVNETSSSQTLLIDKIRYVRDGNNGHVDIHYASSSSNTCIVDFAVHFDPSRYGAFTAVTPTKVDDSPVSPATVLTEYTFAANTEGTGTITAGTYTGTLSIYYLYRQGKIVTGHVNLSLGSTAAAGGWRNIAVVPSEFKPLYNVDFNAVDNASDESIHARIYSATGNIDIYPSSDKPSGRNIILAFTYYTG